MLAARSLANVSLLNIHTAYIRVNTDADTSHRQPLSRLRYMSRTTTHADYDQADKLIIVLVLRSQTLYQLKN